MRYVTRLAAMALLVAFGCTSPEPGSSPESDPRGLSVGTSLGNREPGALDGFAQVLEPRRLIFPEDHGPHPEYKSEWWYWIGHLESAEGRRFGYQLTFFRSALKPPVAATPSEPPVSDWRTDQLYMAHFALTDIDGEDFHSFERFSRGAAGLAGAQAGPFRVWLESWSR